MPPKKKIRSGRPKSTYSQMNPEEVVAYHRESVHRHREKNNVAVRVEVVPSPTTTNSVGRPPIMDVPMSPNTLRERKKMLMAKKRNKIKVSKRRSESAMMRWKSGKDDVVDVNDDSIVHEPADVDDNFNDSPANLSPTVSRTTFYRLRASLVSMFLPNPVDNLKLFILCLPHFNLQELPYPKMMDYAIWGSLNERQLRYRKQMVLKLLSKNTDGNVHKDFCKYWIENLFQDRWLQYNIINNWVIPEEFIPKSVHVSLIAAKVGEKFLQRRNTVEAKRVQGVSYVIAVAKEVGLKFGTYKDISALSDATNCSRHFARLVLKSIEEKTENDLLRRNVRCDSIKATQWPNLISSFVFQPDNSRAVPGQASVSVRYGVRRPKYILLESKECIASKFKEVYPECKFGLSAIIREFPQNAVTPSSRDKERNTCPYHANARRLLRCLHRNHVAKTIPLSCRSMCGFSMCSSEDIVVEEPLTWKKQCVDGTCQECPILSIEIPNEIRKTNVTYSIWRKGERIQEDSRKTKKGQVKKKVFGLFPEIDTIENVVSSFVQSLPKLKLHIYTAHKQWNAHASAREKLSTDSIISIEDYQRNIEVEYIEKPTSMAYSSNTISVAVYPICVEYRNDEGEIRKGAITFISDDKLHDLQQVRAFEKRMFSILRDEKKLVINHWQRWSDGCGAQFKSQFVNADLVKAKKDFQLENASFCYFEAHEGKNISDTIGSIIKCAFLKGVAKKDEGLRNAADIVKLVHQRKKDQTEKFDFFIVEEFPFIKRIPGQNRASFLIDGITKFHSLFVKDNGIIASDISCTDCSPNAVCENCDEEDVYFLEDGDNNDIDDAYSDEDDDSDLEECDDEDDIGQTDEDSDDDDDDEYIDEDVSAPGNIVWAKYGRYHYPAQVISINDVPSNVRSRLFRSRKPNCVVVRWYGEDSYSWVVVRNLDELAENRCDAARASVNEDMQHKYILAIADLRND